MIIKVDIPPGCTGTEQRIRMEVQQELRYRKMVDASVWKSCDAPPPAVNAGKSREVLILVDAGCTDVGHTLGYYSHLTQEWITRRPGLREGQILSLYQEFLFFGDTLDIDPDFEE